MKSFEMTGITVKGCTIDWPSGDSLETTISRWISTTTSNFLKYNDMPILGASFKDGKGRGYLLGDIMQQAEENLAKKAKEIPENVRIDMSKDITCNLIQRVITEEGPEAFVLAIDTWISKIDTKVSETIDMDLADEFLNDWIKKKIDFIKLNYQSSPMKAQWHVLVSDYSLENVHKECNRLMRKPEKEAYEKARKERGSALMFIVHTKQGDKTVYKRIILPYKEKNGKKTLIENEIDKLDDNDPGEGRFSFVL